MTVITRTVTFEADQLSVELTIEIGVIEESSDGSKTYHLPRYSVNGSYLDGKDFERVVSMLSLRGHTPVFEGV